jgi:UDPglucose 6-dehydrogenase
LVCTSVVSSELIKYSANAFLSTKISFANELSLLAEHCGANIDDVTKGIGLDHRIGPAFLRAGLGWGGSCFAKDTLALVRTAAEYGMQLHITEAARAANHRQRAQAVVRLQQELKILQGKTIGVLGLAFKADTDDLRDSPSLDVVRRLLDRGVRVRAHDPQAMDRARREFTGDIEYCATADAVAAGADALLLATEWPEYRQLKWKTLAKKMRNPLMVDGRNFLDSAVLEKAGFRYVAFGR